MTNINKTRSKIAIEVKFLLKMEREQRKPRRPCHLATMEVHRRDLRVNRNKYDTLVRMTDIKGRDRKNRRAGVSRNTNAQSVFDSYAHRPVPRSGYCESIMSFYEEAADRTSPSLRPSSLLQCHHTSYANITFDNWTHST